MAVQRDETGAVVALRGEIDVDTADGIDEAVSLARLAGHSCLVLDLSGVTFLDSQGIKALVVAHQAMAAAGGGLVLRGPRRQVRTILEITGLGEVMSVED